MLGGLTLGFAMHLAIVKVILHLLGNATTPEVVGWLIAAVAATTTTATSVVLFTPTLVPHGEAG